MTRVKKTYCTVSLIVAMVVLVLTLSWSVGGTTVYAASMDPDSITTFDGDNSEGGVTRAAEDSTNDGTQEDRVSDAADMTQMQDILPEEEIE